MVKTVQGNLAAVGLRFGIVLPRFNDIFGDRLRTGALDCLTRHGASEADITVVRVPGCFDMPVAVAALAAGGRVDALKMRLKRCAAEKSSFPKFPATE